MKSFKSGSRIPTEKESLAIEVLSYLLPGLPLPPSSTSHKASKELKQGSKTTRPSKRSKRLLPQLPPSPSALINQETHVAKEPQPTEIQEGIVSVYDVVDSEPEGSNACPHPVKLSQKIDALIGDLSPSPYPTLCPAYFTSPLSPTLAGLETPLSAQTSGYSTCLTSSETSRPSKRARLTKERSKSPSDRSTNFIPRRSVRKPPGPPSRTPESIQTAVSRRQRQKDPIDHIQPSGTLDTPTSSTGKRKRPD